MKPKTFMLIAGEASGDLLAAELVSALRKKLPDATFFGAGGAKMAAAGVELAFDLTQHSVIGISDVLKNYFKFRRLFKQLLALAIERKPDVIIGIDFGGFNLRFGHAIKKEVRKQFGHGGSISRQIYQHIRHGGPEPDKPWLPKIVQFVSPQVWASRPKRAQLLERDHDLLLSIFPFEKDWYARRAPKLRVEFVGHPMLGRFTNDDLRFTRREPETASIVNRKSQILLLPGSRKSELQRHLPVILPALKLIREKLPDAKAKMVLPNENLKELAVKMTALSADLEIQIGHLPDALAQADAAIASTGTVTMECAFFGVPTVTLYKTSWLTFQIGVRIVTVKSLTMPNLLAGEEVYPEFIQHFATPENIAGAVLELLQNESRRQKMKAQLEKIVASLGEPGAANRAAAAILELF
ncbi:MAG TPA: lipid-A-disaccharide synthase [Verrucomicrobiae bacterium]|nr:lipid-A-disaccharide synthase [Verrucomicrobiae bacterium]